jgi:hypothetical protein
LTDDLWQEKGATGLGFRAAPVRGA